METADAMAEPPQTRPSPDPDVGRDAAIDASPTPILEDVVAEVKTEVFSPERSMSQQVAVNYESMGDEDLIGARETTEQHVSTDESSDQEVSSRLVDDDSPIVAEDAETVSSVEEDEDASSIIEDDEEASSSLADDESSIVEEDTETGSSVEEDDEASSILEDDDDRKDEEYEGEDEEQAWVRHGEDDADVTAERMPHIDASDDDEYLID
jgi:hypothetical protein